MTAKTTLSETTSNAEMEGGGGGLYYMIVGSGWFQLVILGSKKKQNHPERSENVLILNSTANSAHDKTLTKGDPTNVQKLTVDPLFSGFTLTNFEVFVGVLSALPCVAQFRKSSQSEGLMPMRPRPDSTVDGNTQFNLRGS